MKKKFDWTGVALITVQRRETLDPFLWKPGAPLARWEREENYKGFHLLLHLEKKTRLAPSSLSLSTSYPILIFSFCQPFPFSLEQKSLLKKRTLGVVCVDHLVTHTHIWNQWKPLYFSLAILKVWMKLWYGTYMAFPSSILCNVNNSVYEWMFISLYAAIPYSSDTWM